MPCNAPVMAIPGSHKNGIVSEAALDSSSEDFETVSKYRYDITPETLSTWRKSMASKPSWARPVRFC